MGITISNSQGLWLRFSLRNTPQHLWVMWVYIVCTESVYQIGQSSKNRMFRQCLVRRPYPRATRETRLSPSYPDSLHSNHVQGTCIISRDAWSWATCENSSVFNLLEFSHSLSHTQPLQLNLTINTGYKRLNKITIKFDIELKPTKQIVVNYNFTNNNNNNAWNTIFWKQFHNEI